MPHFIIDCSESILALRNPKEILDDGKGGTLFKTSDYKDLARKILLYSKNKKKYKINFKCQK